MTVTDPDSSEALCREILAGAEREHNDILERAGKDAAEVINKANSGADDVRLRRIEEARAESERIKEITHASASVEASRLRLERIETLLESIRAEVRKELSGLKEIGDYKDIVIDLAVVAIQSMDGDGFTVRLPEGDHSILGDHLGPIIASKTGRPDRQINISYEPMIAGSGPVIEDIHGTQICDMRPLARLDRLWPEFRRLIAQKMFPDAKEAS